MTEPSAAATHSAASEPGLRASLPELGFIALALSALVLGLNNDLQEFDPTQYAEIARRISESGDWAHFQDVFGPYLDKPPVTLWLIALCIRLLGPTSIAVRLPSLFAGIALVGTTFLIGRRLWDRRTGAVAAALLASSAAFQLMVADPKIDMVVTALMTFSVYCLLAARDRPWMMVPAWLGMGLGVLTKGPIGLVAPLAAVFPEAIRQRWGARPGAPAASLWEKLRPFQPWFGLPIVAACLLPWYSAVVDDFGLKGVRFLLWDQSFGRLFERSYRNQTSPLFFTHTLLWAFLPFTPILLFSLGRAALAQWRSPGFAPRESRVVLWWLLIPFVAISASSYKLPQYLYWLAPPAALLAADALRGLGHATKAMERLYTALSAGWVLFAALLGWVCFPSARWQVTAAWTLGTALATLAATGWALRLPGSRRLVALAVLPICMFHLFYEGWVHPAVTRYQPDREWGALARQEDPSGTLLPFIGTQQTNGAAFYANRLARPADVPALLGWVKEGKTRLAVIEPGAEAQVLAAGLRIEGRWERPSFWTSRPTAAFLLARTRDAAVHKLWMLKLSLPAQAGDASSPMTSRSTP